MIDWKVELERRLALIVWTAYPMAIADMPDGKVISRAAWAKALEGFNVEELVTMHREWVGAAIRGENYGTLVADGRDNNSGDGTGPDRGVVGNVGGRTEAAVSLPAGGDSSPPGSVGSGTDPGADPGANYRDFLTDDYGGFYSIPRKK